VRELRKSLDLGGIALLSIACCVGLPLIAAAGLTVAAFTWIGGIAIGAVALAAALTLLVTRIRTPHSCELSVPPTPRSPL